MRPVTRLKWLPVGLIAALHLAVALHAVQLAVGPWRAVGQTYGEGWGRQFVTMQAVRWAQGVAPLGWADLLAAPDGRTFWPVDPITQLVSVPIAAATDSATALLVAMIILLWTAGFGPALLARTLGARWLGAALAGLLIQTTPLLLDNAADVILETLAFGPLAWVVGATRAAWHQPRWTGQLHAGVAWAVLAGTSPYAALSAGIALGGVLLWTGPLRGLPTLSAAAIGAGLMLMPLVLAETGPGGRLTQNTGDAGYALIPGDLVRIDQGRFVPVDRPTLPVLPDIRAPATPAPLRDPVPAGTALLLAGLLGLTHRRARPWVLLGAGFLVLGPGPALLARQLHWGTLPLMGLLGTVLEVLPFGASLGNGSRLLVPWILAAAVGGAIGARGGLRMAVLVGAAALSIAQARPKWPLPASWLPGPLPPASLTAGPLTVFPSGDPPWWHPAVAPKESLWIAGQMGTPVAFDYGRGGTPADRELMLQLAAASGVPVGRDALKQGLPPVTIQWGPSVGVLVLRDRLDAGAAAKLELFLEAHAQRLWTGQRTELWVPR